ncbi:hypothetical protein [Neobacillus rhizosphaerae]
MAGKGIANPLAAIWSVSQIFDYLNMKILEENTCCHRKNLGRKR